MLAVLLRLEAPRRKLWRRRVCLFLRFCTCFLVSRRLGQDGRKTCFNFQFFLNEECKDAMNLSDFIDSFQLEFTDLEKVGKLGYVDGISNIII